MCEQWAASYTGGFYSKAAAWERKNVSGVGGGGVFISWKSKQRTIVKLEELFCMHVSIILMKSGEGGGGNARSNNRDHRQNLPQSEQVEIRWARRGTQQLLSLSWVCVCALEIQIFPHRKHVIALHVSGVLVLALVVKLPEEVEGQNSVEVDDNGQQPHSQDQLKGY